MPKINDIASEIDPLWYHCGRCGSLFQSVTHASKDHRCSECGSNPSPTITDKNTQTSRFTKTVNSVDNIKKYSQNPVKEQVRRKKSNHFLVILVVIWMVAIGLIVLAIKTIWSVKEIPNPVSNATVIETAAESENLALLNKYTSKCWDTLKKFLQAGLPEQRSQYVSQPITAVTRMTRYQDFEAMGNISLPTLNSSQWSVVSIGAEKSIEGFWMNEDGRCFDALFRKEQEEWLIDWEYFVRYSDMLLTVFLSGNGDAEGEFRLLARERLAEDRKNQPTISIMFYAPVFGRPTETGAPSPEFLVQRNSPAGKLLEAAFAALKNKKRPFNAKTLNVDPEGMIRVRVKIRRSGEMDTRAFDIVELKACHWYSSDLPGFDVDNEGEVKN
jgi:hypothetical protein